MSFEAMTWAVKQKLPVKQKIVLLMLAEDFEMLEGKDLSEALVESAEVLRRFFLRAGELGGVVGGEDQRTPDFSLRRRLNCGKRLRGGFFLRPRDCGREENQEDWREEFHPRGLFLRNSG